MIDLDIASSHRMVRKILNLRPHHTYQSYQPAGTPRIQHPTAPIPSRLHGFTASARCHDVLWDFSGQSWPFILALLWRALSWVSWAVCIHRHHDIMTSWHFSQCSQCLLPLWLSSTVLGQSSLLQLRAVDLFLFVVVFVVFVFGLNHWSASSGAWWGVLSCMVSESSTQLARGGLCLQLRDR